MLTLLVWVCGLSLCRLSITGSDWPGIRLSTSPRGWTSSRLAKYSMNTYTQWTFDKFPPPLPPPQGPLQLPIWELHCTRDESLKTSIWYRVTVDTAKIITKAAPKWILRTGVHRKSTDRTKPGPQAAVVNHRSQWHSSLGGTEAWPQSQAAGCVNNEDTGRPKENICWKLPSKLKQHVFFQLIQMFFVVAWACLKRFLMFVD